MNNTDVMTNEKVMMTLRLPPETYAKLMEKVFSEKKKQRGYSINQYITLLIENELSK